jgi:hypothetical protein
VAAALPVFSGFFSQLKMTNRTATKQKSKGRKRRCEMIHPDIRIPFLNAHILYPPAEEVNNGNRRQLLAARLL